VARKVLVELEVPEGRSLEEILRGIRYRGWWRTWWRRGGGSWRGIPAS